MENRWIRTFRAILVGAVLMLSLAGCEKLAPSSDTTASVELIGDQSTTPFINQDAPTNQVSQEQSAMNSQSEPDDLAPVGAEQIMSEEIAVNDVSSQSEPQDSTVISQENPSEPTDSGAEATADQKIPTDSGAEATADQKIPTDSGAEATADQKVRTDSGTAATADQEVPTKSIEPVSITITATGDCTLGTTQTHSYENSFDEVYDKNGGPEYFFENVRDIFEQDDMTMINLECSLTTSTDRQDKQWNLKGKPEYIDILTNSSIEAVSMGNNHRLDYGESGFEETVKLLEDAEIVYAYDARVGIYETKGISIGIVSVNEHYDGTLVEEFLQQGIAQLKEEEVDLILACCHWGIEGTGRLDDYQVELGYKCIDWGADLVIGNHPHVLQGVNKYKDKYIVYSLGNFSFGGNKNPKDKDTMIFQQTFTFAQGELMSDDNIRIIPCSISSVKNKNNYQPTPATGKEAERIIEKVNKYSKEFHIQFDKEGYLQ